MTIKEPQQGSHSSISNQASEISHEQLVKSSMERDADTIDLAAAEEPVRHMQGIKTVREALKLEDFPMSKSDVDYCVGDIDIEDGHGGFIPVYQLTERFKSDLFDSPDEIIIALKEARKGFKEPAA